jgi:ATP-binding cassette subfamily B multidrug efflux pump
MLVAFIMYLNMLFRPARTLADKFNTLQMGLVAADRVFALLDTDQKPTQQGHPYRPYSRRYNIRECRIFV